MSDKPEIPAAGLSRRRFLGGVTAGGITAAASPLVAARGRESIGVDAPLTPSALGRRAQEAFLERYFAAASYLRRRPTLPAANGDEAFYPDFRTCFFKTLPQNAFGEVEPRAFRRLVRALEKGSSRAMERVPTAATAQRKLANPLAAHAFEMIGPDSWSLRMPPAPAFSSAQQAAEMAEVYWQALTRDIPFRDYDVEPDIAAAADDLNAFSHRLGAAGAITPANLFRGETPGDRVGPYLSQFLWLPAQWGLAELGQRFKTPLPLEDFGIDLDEWRALQRGENPRVAARFDNTPRHIASARDLAEYVHGDVIYQAYLTAALVALGFGPAALDRNDPYAASTNQAGFVTFGAAEIADLVAKVAHVALKAAWFQKWLVHRRLRPEVLAARAEFEFSGQRAYEINPELFGSAAIGRLLGNHGNLLLPLAYPEGSPTHPSYPAGHATVAGACSTVLKALFNEDFEIPAPVQASADGLSLDPWSGAPLTIGGEFNKLASNISLGRDAAGVHYRSDGIDGLNLGEEVALGVLADYARSRAEDFDGFELTRFDGETVRVGAAGDRRWWR